jgi:hypothetical protein
MNWTTTLPTLPGWYFWRPGDTTDKVFVAKGRRRGLPPGVYQVTGAFDSFFLMVERQGFAVGMLNGQWAGPIEEPEESTEAKP